jgi:hypothetical protein
MFRICLPIAPEMHLKRNEVIRDVRQGISFEMVRNISALWLPLPSCFRLNGELASKRQTRDPKREFRS